MGKYTDEQNVMIAQKEYVKYDVSDEVFIEDMNTGNKITVGYVAEVIHNPVGRRYLCCNKHKIIKKPYAWGTSQYKRCNYTLSGFFFS